MAKTPNIKNRSETGYLRQFLICAVLVVVTTAVYYQVCRYNFVSYDDNIYVYNNPHIRAGITPDTIKWAFTTDYSHMYHPLTWVSLMLDWQLFGTNAGGYHLTNLIIHIVNTLLLFIVLKKMTRALWPSAFVAALFALHPLHVESVAWVTERKDVLSTFFWLLTVLAYVRYVKRPKIIGYLLVVVFYAFSLLSKPMVVTLPFVLLLLDYWPLDRFRAKRSLRRLLIEKIPLFAMVVILSIVTFVYHQQGESTMSLEALSIRIRIYNSLISYMQYIIKMIWPARLAFFYPYLGQNVSVLYAVISAIILPAITIFVLLFSKKHRYLFTGWFWYLGMLVPVIGLVQVGSQAMADRYSYMTLTGLFIIIAWGLPELLGKWPYRKTALGVSMVIVLTVLGICAHRQVSCWKNSFTLFSHALKVTQNNWLAYNNLGVIYDNSGRGAEAIENFKQAVKLKPDFANAPYNLGVAYGKLGRHQEAIEAFKQAIRIDSNYAQVHYNLGIAYINLGRWQDAVEACKQAIKIKPNYAEAHYNLGVSYEGLGRYQDAAEAYKQAIRIKPDYADAYLNLGVTYSELGRYQDEVEAYKQAIKIRPNYAEAHYNLGFAYLITGDKGLAFEEYKILKTLDAEKANDLFKLINK